MTFQRSIYLYVTDAAERKKQCTIWSLLAVHHGFVVVLVFYLLANVIAAQMQSGCGIAGVLGLAGCADDIVRAGFPWVVWEEGGFAYRRVFDPAALLLNLGVGLLACVAGGLLAARRASRPVS